MSKTAEARAFFEGVEVITTVENTYRPQLNGTRRRIARLGRTFYDAVMLDDTTNGAVKAGSECRGNIPSRASKVIAVSDTEATFCLGAAGSRLASYRLTLRKGG